MKSDNEFLNGVYKKAEELKAVLEAEKKITEEEVEDILITLEPSVNQKRKHKYITSYPKYAGMAAGFILLISSSIYFVKLQGNNNPIDLPDPHGVKIINYSGQTLEQATDIVKINVKDNNGVLQHDIVKVYKDSGNETIITAFFNNNNIGLIAGDSAIAFLQADSSGAVLMETFIKTEANTYVSPFGEVVTEEELDELSK